MPTIPDFFSREYESMGELKLIVESKSVWVHSVWLTQSWQLRCDERYFPTIRTYTDTSGPALRTRAGLRFPLTQLKFIYFKLFSNRLFFESPSVPNEWIESTFGRQRDISNEYRRRIHPLKYSVIRSTGASSPFQPERGTHHEVGFVVHTLFPPKLTFYILWTVLPRKDIRCIVVKKVPFYVPWFGARRRRNFFIKHFML